MKSRKIIILGGTGSIGSTALHALTLHRDTCKVVGISAYTQEQKLIETLKQTGATHAAFPRPLTTSLPQGITYWNNPCSMVEQVEADIVLNGISGTAGLEATIAALTSGKDVALANKESIVLAGQFLFDLAKKHGAKIIPVDSEHAAIDTLIQAHGTDKLDAVILTASGGPFLGTSAEDMKTISASRALDHPTWSMGRKISIDSATMANKGMEVIEASYLFDMPAHYIEVVIHPQSIVHSMIRLTDGAVYAQMSPPDMTLPIMHALLGSATYQRNLVTPLDFTNLSLTFLKPDNQKFPLLPLAYECIRSGKSYPLAYSIANEASVEAFLSGRISFTGISDVVATVMNEDWSEASTTIEVVKARIDAVRAITEDAIKGLETSC